MEIQRPVAEDIARRGYTALQRGDGAEARSCFTQLVDGGYATTDIQLLLARALRLSGDADAEAAALDAILEREPQNLWALLLRGDWCARAGDSRAAASFYQSAIKGAAGAKSLPADVTAELRKAQQFIHKSGAEFQAAIDDAVSQAGFVNDASGLRVRHAVEMLAGKREIYLQEPSVFYVPYLAQRQFFEREEFDWVPALEAQTPDIKQELTAVLEEGAPFRPYVEREKNRPARDVLGLLDDPRWSALYLWRNGRIVEQNAARCPKTMAALEQVPLSRIGSRTPSVLFSMLRPGAHIPPHHGMLNCRLICHLPLIVPPGCWLRVGNETRQWEEGKLLIFDDSITHEAKNPTDQARVILLFDIWKPELSCEERDGVSAIFDTIDRFTTLPDA